VATSRYHDGTEVRPSRSQDLPAIQDVLKAAPEAAAWSPEGLRATLESDPAHCLCAWRKEEIVGFIAGRRVTDEGEILNLAVGMPSRRRGVGRILVETLLSSFVREGVARVFLEVRESNGAAISFYRQLGFRLVGTRRGYYQEPDESALVLALDTGRPGM